MLKCVQNNIETPNEDDVIFNTLEEMFQSDYDNNGVPVYVHQTKSYYTWYGLARNELFWYNIKEKGEQMLIEAEYDTQALTWNPTAKILDGDGMPTNVTIQIDEWLDNTRPALSERPKTAWQTLNELTPEESEAIVAQYAADDMPITRILTYWEYIGITTNPISREEYGAGRVYRFEYNNGVWTPVEDMDHTGVEE